MTMLQREEYGQNMCYLPICLEYKCNGLLDIKIDENEFLISAVCRKNPDHKYHKLYFKTFENYFLKKICLKQCNRCQKILENDDVYKCPQCNVIYCVSCYIYDEHFKEKNNNFEIITKNCQIHNKKLDYCFDCLEKICENCMDNKKDNFHKRHRVINANNKQTQNSNDSFREKVKIKLDDLKGLIDSINTWENDLKQKINSLKQNIREEIEIIIKLLSINFEYTQKYIYVSNLNNYFAKKGDNDFFEKFIQTPDFKEKTKFIFDALFYPKPTKIVEEAFLKKICSLDQCGIIKNFTNDSFLICNNSDNKIILAKYDSKNKKYDINCCEINLNEKIASLNFSDDHKKIYACSNKNLKVIIIDFKPEKNIMEISNEEIKNNGLGHFKKCIHLKNDLVLTITIKCIYFWRKSNNDSKKYNIDFSINFDDSIYDIEKINSELIIFSQSGKINFFSLNEYNIIKIIKNIDCLYESDNFVIIKDYILVNCGIGIAIISINTKEIVQYIEVPCYNLYSKLAKSKNEEIFLYNYFKDISVLKFNLIENNLFLTEKIKVNEFKYDYNDDNDGNDDNDDLEKYHSNNTNINDNLSIVNNLIINNDNIIVFQKQQVSLLEKIK